MAKIKAGNLDTCSFENGTGSNESIFTKSSCAGQGSILAPVLESGCAAIGATQTVPVPKSAATNGKTIDSNTNAVVEALRAWLASNNGQRHGKSPATLLISALH